MKITAIDGANDLFLVENILPMSLIEYIKTQDFWQYSWEYQEMQADTYRRKLITANQLLFSNINRCYRDKLDQIAEVTNVTFIDQPIVEHRCWSSFWLDYHGFDCHIHEDGAERNYSPRMAMQIYLTESADNLGTVFYNDALGKQIRYAFPYKINTGYLMLNHPGQWHGMINKVPAGHIRLSSYTYFMDFSHK